MSPTEEVPRRVVERERREGRRRFFEPTREQELLLCAALREGEEAVDAWREWRATAADIARLDDVASQRLLPLVYRNLRARTPPVPSLERVKGTYRYSWYKNRLLLRATAACLRAFHEAGIETVVLKGTALISCYYEDVGCRFMADSDVLVREEQASAAIQVLLDRGWQRFDPHTQRSLDVASPERFPPYGHSLTFANEERMQCDLHISALPECIRTEGNDGFWDASVPARVGGVPTRVLAPADQILQVCVHGITRVRDDTAPPVDWIADAVTIATTASASRDGMDWQRLVEQARKLRLILPVRETLSYLRDAWGVGVPAAALHGLWEGPVSGLERIEHVGRRGPQTVLGQACRYWSHNARLAGDAGIGHQLVRFPVYLRGVYELKHSWQIPFRMAYALARRVGLVGSQN
jgi:Uncharacterised nucleotidyltransferase